MISIHEIIRTLSLLREELMQNLSPPLPKNCCQIFQKMRKLSKLCGEQVWFQLTPPLKSGRVSKNEISAGAAKQVCHIIQFRMHIETIPKKLDSPPQRDFIFLKVNQKESEWLKITQSESKYCLCHELVCPPFSKILAIESKRWKCRVFKNTYQCEPILNSLSYHGQVCKKTYGEERGERPILLHITMNTFVSCACFSHF